ncbi:MAG: lysophospholipid acyltransferase family protein [Spirochaetia bacterium]|jgi:1-acyl-sn-glycerol-3-phosphate acyltransferase|nr:lysophospholipid acyltransferase family protein [Spirochaetia bacterium]
MARTILFYTAMWVPIVLGSPIALIYIILVKLGLGKLFEGFIHLGSSNWAKMVLKTTGSTITIEGLEKIPDEKGLCFVGNHQSAIDILIVLSVLPVTVGYIAKKQLLYYPFLNLWIVALRSAFIDRGNVKNALRSIEKGIEFIKKGNSMIIFPEGTRSKSDTMGTFKNGSIKLATRAEATIVPLTISGSWHAWEENLRIGAADINFMVHEAVPTRGISADERKALGNKLSEIIGGGLN